MVTLHGGRTIRQLIVWTVALCCCCGGCAGGPRPIRFRWPWQQPSAVPAQPAGGLHEYELRNGRWVRRESVRPMPPALRRAEALIQEQRYDEAISLLDDTIDADDETPGAVHRYGLFLLAEAYYWKGDLVAARTHYEKLLDRYPGTEEALTAATRLYQIGTRWLDAAANDDTQPAGMLRRIAFWRQSDRPWIDADGHAIKVLEYIQEHDPGNPLADDAILAIANYQFRRGNFEQAAFYYDLLIQGYPKSEHLAHAYLRAAEARLALYDGAEYNAKPLEEARRLLQTAATQFPELADQRPRIYEMLHRIEERQAERDFQVARFYERIGRPDAARVYYQLVIRDYPKTSWAQRARQRLEELGLEQQGPQPKRLSDLLDELVPSLAERFGLEPDEAPADPNAGDEARPSPGTDARSAGESDTLLRRPELTPTWPGTVAEPGPLPGPPGGLP